MKRTRLPEDWRPSPAAWARGVERLRQAGLDPEDQLEAFKDHHIGKGNLMADWDRAFSTWTRNALRFAPKGSAPPPTHSKPVDAETRQEQINWYLERGLHVPFKVQVRH